MCWLLVGHSWVPPGVLPSAEGRCLTPNQANSPGAATYPTTSQYGGTKTHSPHLNLGHLRRAFQASELPVRSAEGSAATESQFSVLLLSNSASQTSVPKRLFKKFPAHKSLAQSPFPRTWPPDGSLLTYSKAALKPREEKTSLRTTQCPSMAAFLFMTPPCCSTWETPSC